MRAIESDVQLAECVDLNVLIVGENSADAAAVARFVHARSRRRDAPFISISCAQLSAARLECEVRAATELAHRGSLLLENVDDLTADGQTALLKLIQAADVVTSPDIPVRLMATARQTLFDRVIAGTFLKDLYYRLNTIYIAPQPAQSEKFVLVPTVTGSQIDGRV